MNDDDTDHMSEEARQLGDILEDMVASGVDARALGTFALRRAGKISARTGTTHATSDFEVMLEKYGQKIAADVWQRFQAEAAAQGRPLVTATSVTSLVVPQSAAVPRAAPQPAPADAPTDLPQALQELLSSHARKITVRLGGKQTSICVPGALLDAIALRHGDKQTAAWCKERAREAEAGKRSAIVREKLIELWKLADASVMQSMTSQLQ